MLLLDMTFIFLHVVYGWSVINLDEEGNLTAWYSSTKLFVMCILTGRIWADEQDCKIEGKALKFTGLWLFTSAIFLFLSADETGSLHERLARTIMQESSMGLDVRETVLGGDQMKDSFAWVFLLSPFIAGVALFFGIFFYKRLIRQKAALAASMAALGLFLMAVGLEATIYAAPSFSEWTQTDLERYKLFLAIEESGEIFGCSLFICAFYLYWRFLQKRKPPALS